MSRIEKRGHGLLLGHSRGGLLTCFTGEKWSACYLVILDGFLIVYDSEACAIVGGQAAGLFPRAIFPLRGCSAKEITRNADDTSHIHAFELSDAQNGGLALTVAVGSEALRADWLQTIKACTATLNRLYAPPSGAATGVPAHAPTPAAGGLVTPASPTSPDPSIPLGDLQLSSPTATTPAKKSASSFPKVGDHVLAYHLPTTCYYFATVEEFRRKDFDFLVKWDDGDPSGRVVHFDRIALDKVPSEDEVAEGSLVIFPQGVYVGTAGTNEGGMRYHQGIITRTYLDGTGTRRYDGRHTLPYEERKMKYRAYTEELTGLSLADLRMPPNALDLALDDAQSTDGISYLYDIFLIYNPRDSPLARASGLGGDLPSYGDLIVEASDPRVLKRKLSDLGLKIWCDFENPGEAGEYGKQAEIMKRSRIIVACVSNAFALNSDNRMQIQFARKTLGKPIIPLVVESFERGPPWRWQGTAIGLLLAGELYVDFTDISKESQRLNELKAMVDGHVAELEGGGSADAASASKPGRQASKSQHSDIFVSYCWSNSFDAKQNRQVGQLDGRAEADPRAFAQLAKEQGKRVWLDIWTMSSGGQLFEQIADGLLNTSLVVAFVSDHYARSENCRMEFAFCCKTLMKPVITVICGSGDTWQGSVVGMIVQAQRTPPIDLRVTGDARTIWAQVQRALERVQSGKPLHDEDGPPGYSASSPAIAPATPQQQQRYRAPKKGDHVMAYHAPTTCFYACTVVDFNKATMEYTVNWDDGDPSGRIMSFEKVALDVAPQADEIAVDSVVIFPQGLYVGGPNNSGGTRYHEGIVSRIYTGPDGVRLYDGEHLLKVADGKMNFKAYRDHFVGLRLEELRMGANAMDALMANH